MAVEGIGSTRFAIVLNSSAGSLLDRTPADAVATVERAFAQQGHRVVCEAVQGADLPRAIRVARDGSAEVLVVGGGDGTIATAAHLLQGSGKVLGVLPLGTMNLLARDLDIPLDLDAAAAALARGRIDHIDCGEVNGHPFLNNSVIGLYPRMVLEREARRGAHGWRKWPAMAWAFGKVLADFPRLHVQLEMEAKDGSYQALDLTTPFLAIANNDYDEGFGPILHRQRLDAGVLALYAARNRRRIQVLRLVAGVVLGRWRNNPDLDLHHVTEAVVHSRRPRLRVANDGEVLTLETPLHYRIRPASLAVLRPAAESVLRTPA